MNVSHLILIFNRIYSVDCGNRLIFLQNQKGSTEKSMKDGSSIRGPPGCSMRPAATIVNYVYYKTYIAV
jgi:hypothetical protein